MTSRLAVPRRLPSQSWIGRLFSKTDVTVCIPAYQASAFIGRTLRCAQGQIYGHIRILVSVDRSEDDTTAIAREFAWQDRRIEVVEHRDRLGWQGNVNDLLARVDTPFFVIYFHDDVVLPQYCAFLRDALLAAPDAASAHCDVLDFGETEAVRRGRPYQGPVAARLLTLWAAPQRGAPLRSMIRSAMVGADYRLTSEGSSGFALVETLMARLMAAGPACHVPETLYLRWQRTGGVMDRWRKMPFDQVLLGWRHEMGAAFALIDEKVDDAGDCATVKHALVLWALRSLAARCREEQRPLPAPNELHPDAPELAMPRDLGRFGADIEQNFQNLRRDVARLTQALG